MINIDSESFHKKHEYYTNNLYGTEELPHRYVFILTNKCNLKCKYCYQKKIDRYQYLSSRDWIEFSNQLPQYARVTLTGGEPLLYEGFRSVFSEIASKFSCNLITNGTLLNRELIDYLLSFPNFSALSVSIDTLNGDVRPLSVSQKRELENNLKYFVLRRNELQSQCILDIKTLILDENVDELLEICKYCADIIESDNHTIQFLKGSPIQHSDIMYDFNQIFEQPNPHIYKKFDSILKQIDKIKLCKKKSTKFFMHPTILNINEDKNVEELKVLNESFLNTEYFSSCKYPWSSIHINYDGNVFPCLSVPMGNIKDSQLIDIIKSPQFRLFKETIKKNGLVNACIRCGWLKKQV